jgi:hypothetical protein
MTAPEPSPADRAREVISRLIELTPEPGLDATAESLLAAFEGIVARRAEVLARIVPPLRVAEADRPLIAELERRQQRWQDALAAALQVVGQQRHANHQLRAYARLG